MDIKLKNKELFNEKMKLIGSLILRIIIYYIVAVIFYIVVLDNLLGNFLGNTLYRFNYNLYEWCVYNKEPIFLFYMIIILVIALYRFFSKKVDNIESRRIIAEHLRSSMMVISDGGRPSNVDRGYILRRLIRRMVRHMNKLQINLDEISTLVDINVENLKEMYPDLAKNEELIKNVIIEEKNKFVKTLAHGEKE